MSGNRPHRPPLDRQQYRTANEIVRNILDDRRPTSEVSPSGELYRAIERFHHNTDRFRRYLTDVTDVWSPGDNRSMSSGSDGYIPPPPPYRHVREPLPTSSSDLLPGISSLTDAANADAGPGASPGASVPPSLPPLRSLASRRGTSMSSGNGFGSRSNRLRPFLERNRSSTENRPTAADFRALSHNLGDANSHLRALLDFTTNSPTLQPLISHPPSPPLHTQDHHDDNRRVKRRKLDSDRLSSNFKGFRYGKYGQVEPGQLIMEIASCDGGMYSDEAVYAAENILKPGNSVYCTKGNRCNIVLRHQGATVFSLKELIIKAPGQNFSSPVREGMVFISMNSDDLLTRTAQYQIQYVPSRGQGPQVIEREPRPLASIAPVASIRHDDRGATLTRALRQSRRLYSIGFEDDEEYRTAQIPSEFTVSPPPFRVTTECSDDEDEVASRPYHRTPNRIGALPFESDSEDEENPFGPDDISLFDEIGRPSHPGNHDSPMTLMEAAEASQLATQEAVRAVGGELMAPHARFYIEKDKNKCTLRFDPPVSGRFILLKMWNPTHDPRGNIDIQGVTALGYAGPRYFPSVELR